MEIHLGTWTGLDFGYRDGEELWTHDGRHVGRFHGGVVYSPNGRYLGELKHDDRLISRSGKRSVHRAAFTRLPDRLPRAAFVAFGGFPMPESYEDFPGPEAFR